MHSIYELDEDESEKKEGIFSVISAIRKESVL